MSKKWVYSFTEGDASLRNLMGGKGANLAEMTKIGLPVPPGFAVTTQSCLNYYEHNQQISAEMEQQILEHLARLEEQTGKKLGGKENPLLVSIRSGAAVSMPGMMDTILNLGLNDDTVQGLAKATGNVRFALDSYRRFIQMFSDVACATPKHRFDRALDDLKKKYGVKSDAELSIDQLKELIEQYKNIHLRQTGEVFPQDPLKQLFQSIRAVFDSWNNRRAITYRQIHGIPDDMGTAVNIQSMVFGNMGDDSGTGVAFSRNPSTGENLLFGEYLLNAQGEDIVAGIRTPKNISDMEREMPHIFKEFKDVANKLELHYREMQDIEFTIEKEKLYILQTRTGKRSVQAALRIATDFVEEGLITKEEALMRIEPQALNQLLHPTFDQSILDKTEPLAQGLPASPGAATGKIYFNADEAVEAAEQQEPVLLVREETSPEDISGMNVALGILTARGGMTSHAAVVARGMGKCCVAGCEEALIDEVAKTLTFDGKVFHEGDFISLDGSTGKIYAGSIPTAAPGFSEDFNKLMQYAADIKELGVRANADTAHDAQVALDFGVEGIGLCRTEHMFFSEERIHVMRQMILSANRDQRKEALEKLLPMQTEDFVGIFTVMQELPVTIRLLDPPLHEFLPSADRDIVDLAASMNTSVQSVRETINSLKEINPMLGHRGCRLAITYPEIAVMQTRAIISAAITVARRNHIKVRPEIMIPLVGIKEEFSRVKAIIHQTANEVMREMNYIVEYLVGTMIEIPRAVLLADRIAEEAEFFSFGTNDLTQMGFGFSRDDAGKFINDYLGQGILQTDPFETIDQEGIGKLVEMGVKLGRKESPELKIGVCGEHAGDPKSVMFFHKTGLDYVSCSPYRVPLAKLAAAQAVLQEKNK